MLLPTPPSCLRGSSYRVWLWPPLMLERSLSFNVSQSFIPCLALLFVEQVVASASPDRRWRPIRLALSKKNKKKD